MQRGNNRTPAFHGAEGFGRYRALLGAASTAATCAIHAYVLMTNHVHLLIIPADVNGAARPMKEVSQGYARWFNRRPRRTGTLTEGRYRSAVGWVTAMSCDTEKVDERLLAFRSASWMTHPFLMAGFGCCWMLAGDRNGELASREPGLRRSCHRLSALSRA